MPTRKMRGFTMDWDGDEDDEFLGDVPPEDMPDSEERLPSYPRSRDSRYTTPARESADDFHNRMMDGESGYWDATSTKGVKDAEKMRGVAELGSAGLEGLGMMFADKSPPVVLRGEFGRYTPPRTLAKTDVKVDTSALRRAGEQGVARAKGERADKIDRFKGRYALERDQRADNEKEDQRKKDAKWDDPQSDVSRKATRLYQMDLLSRAQEAKTAGDNQAADELRKMANGASGMSANEVMTLHKGLKDMGDYKGVLAGNAARERSDAIRTEGAARRGQAQADRMDVKADRGAAKAADKLTPSAELMRSLGRVEQKLGFTLDEYENGKVNGQPVDIAGVSLPGLGRTTFYDGEARVLQGAISNIFNTELKDRSGAAVTSQELERLKDEFNAGKFNSEEELISALKDYRTEAFSLMKDLEAGIPRDGLERYEEQGGTTSKNFERAPKAAPKTPKPAWAK